ncbi:MAG TPA: C40 family peptidase [Burkholderiaceae bacterium]|nr:C40 family peptidase [Burkholderiaceae bacterium]
MLALLAVSADAQERAAGARSDIVLQALSLLGTPYRYGGASPETGFDCSGLVRHVFASALSHDLPRRSEEISGLGEPVARADLQPGDLVFFNTLRRAFSHVAIYIGEGRFIHAPARNGRVRIEGLDDRYWATRFNGARRLVDTGVPGALEQRSSTGRAAAPADPASRSADIGVDRPPGP